MSHQLNIWISYFSIEESEAMLRNHLEKLNRFVGCVKAGSIRGYAITHRLSQPAISKCIQNLETELEVSLLVRGREGIRLSKPGEDLFSFAEQMLTQSDEIESRIRAYGKLQVRGSLVMGTYQSIAVYFIPTLFKFIRKEQPDLNMNLFTAPSQDLVEALQASKVDFIVSIDPPKNSGFHQVRILGDTYSLFRQTGFKDLLARSLIFTLPSAQDKSRKSLRSYLEEVRLAERISNCWDFESAKAMAEQGVGYALLPDRVAAGALEAGRIERVEEMKKLQRIGDHDLVFSCRKYRVSDTAIKWVLDQLLLMLRRN